MSFRYKFKGVWDDQLPAELREPYAASRTTTSAFGTQRPGPYLWLAIGVVLAACGVGIILLAAVGAHPAKQVSDWVYAIVITVLFLGFALWAFRYAWVRLSWAHKVKQLTGVNPLTWDLAKPLPDCRQPDLPLRSQWKSR